MRTAAVLASCMLAGLIPGCLDPLVDDVPGASAHLLPAGASVPSAVDDPELANQIALNDGLDDAALAASNGVVPRGEGASAGAAVHFWSFGAATQAPSPLYQFFADTDAGLQPIDHPGLVDAVPGDPGYSPIHAIIRVVVAAAYNGEQITTTEALADAIELGLVGEPMPSNTVVTSPIVLPGTRLDVGAAAAAEPVAVFARGRSVAMFPLSGALGVQPGARLQPISQVSFLREAHGVAYDANRPIFQATIPTMPAEMRANYTALSAVINVDLADGVTAAMITQDSDLFERNPAGAIVRTTEKVARFELTGQQLLLPLQFTEGQP